MRRWISFGPVGIAALVLTGQSSCPAADEDGDGWSVLDGDCDDIDPAIHPGAAEVCNDGIDNDCDGQRCELPDTISLSGADARILGELEAGYSGSGLAPAGDVNGDGLEDLLIGAYAISYNSGRAYLMYGPLEGQYTLETADATFLPAGPQGNLGTSLASAGDLNGDGFDDILLGATSADGEADASGAAWLLYGPLQGTRSLETADASFPGERPADYAGTGLATLIDGRGDRCVTIGAMGVDTGTPDGGAVYRHCGPAAGELPLREADEVVLGMAQGGSIGSNVAVGDFNGDGIDDLAIGSPTLSRVWLFHGPINDGLELADADAVLEGETAQDSAGVVEAGGDINGDGIEDLLIGAPYADSRRGAAYVVYGPIEGSSSLRDADARLGGEQIEDLAGRSLAPAGDFNGDGYGDIVVGALNANGQAGGAYLFYGPVGGTVSLEAADVRLSGEAVGDLAGYEVAFAGDANGDGYGDFVVGAIGHEGYRGATYLVRGPGWWTPGQSSWFRTVR